MKKEKKQFVIRLHIIFISIIFIGFVLIANLFYIQIIHGEAFRKKADGQYVVTKYNSFERGIIYFKDRNGVKINAASQKTGYKLSINPKSFSKNPDVFYKNIADLIDIDKDVFFSALEKKRSYVEIAHKINKEEAKQLRDIIGIQAQLYPEKWRVYPLKGSASHTLGFLGYQGHEYAGRYGLERSYENTLKRENKDVYTNFFARIFHNIQNFVDNNNTVLEGNIIATIDPHVQLFFENQLKKIKEKWNPESVGGVIINPKTGEVYALGAFPNFDNNNFSKDSVSVFKNPLIENVYEMGSIMKPLVVAIGIDTKSINVDDLQYYDTGFIKVEKHTISNFDGRGRGWIGVQDILSKSLNTGMVYISKQIDKEHFRNYFKKLGFTEKTNIDLPNEAANLSNNLKSTRHIEFANMSFGQGISLTPIAMVRALGSLANKGVITTPHLIEKIEYINGFSKTFDYSDMDRSVFSEETSEEVSRMLVNVFDAYRHGKIQISGYSIAGKTGTAQIPHPEGGYYNDRNLHSFFGYFPAYDPQFLILLYTVYPKKVKYASQTLINSFKDSAKYIINYYNIPPDR